ncbi:MAG: glycosyltransferase [Actinomycetota bacterium]|nr:glycosyltransferase [Actinomycetota bacterium]
MKGGIEVPGAGPVTEAMRPRVLLFTDTYPVAGAEDPFLAVEVRELARRLDLVLIPTTHARGLLSPVPTNVAFEAGLAEYLMSIRGRVAGLLRTLFHPGTYREVASFRSRAIDPRVVTAVVVRGSRMFGTQRWLRRYLVQARPVVAYTWWASSAGYGVARAASDVGIPSVTRIHGYELYPEQDRLGRIPFQESGLARFDAVYSVSRAGAEYLAGEYPSLAPRLHVARLGIDAWPLLGRPSTDGIFRILSCSSCVSIKRVDLLARAMATLLHEHPEVDFRWTHIGAGPTLAGVQQIVNSETGLSERCTFTGVLTGSAVRQLMASEPFDAFVNASSSEGLPVTLMEASSNGMPLIATSVGGNPEIVNDVNGRLIEANPEPHTVADALVQVRLLSLGARDEMRAASFRTWEASFVARNNYSEFARVLEDLWSETT